jgi:hypothetical protein
MPSLRTFHNALNAPPTTTDSVGGGYSFFVNNTLKFGKSNKPRARKGQWKRQCRREQQTWLDFHWEVPYAKKFGELFLCMRSLRPDSGEQSGLFTSS